ncbi:MAG: DUF3872 domain-containing protein, partial [Bacteroidales bacterium]|nr:DUF3872 domain-containing protein [Bacteroidales bacterium]
MLTETDRINLRKALRNLLAAGAVIITIGLLTACNDITIKQDFDFEVTHLPVPSQVGDGEEVELRFQLRHIEGRYDSNRHYVRYFPVQGKGMLVYGDSVLRPNDTYRIGSDEFRMYYTAKAAGEHNLSFSFTDDFGHSHGLNISFNKADTATLPEATQRQRTLTLN